MIHLDTNYLINALQAGSPQESQVACWLTAREALGISAVAWAEFFCGPISRRDELTAQQMFQSVEALSRDDAESAARLFNRAGRRSRSLADCMIAAVAIRCGARLATVNTPDFQPFVAHGLTLA